MKTFPWHLENAKRIETMRSAERLPHALMLHGLPGTGIREFAASLGRLLLCKDNAAGACGDCHSCQLVAAGNHPDLVSLEPEREGGAIKVDQVRELVSFGQATAQLSGYRVIQLLPAEAMNPNAANALLKTLEEPGDDTLLLLVSYAPATVMPTVRSRCQMMAMGTPTVAQSRNWLAQHLASPGELDLLHQFAPQQPLYALQSEALVKELRLVAETLPALIEGRADIQQTAQLWMSVDVHQLLLWLYRWLSAACSHAAVERGDHEITTRIYREWCARAPLESLLQRLDGIVRIRRQLASGSSLNTQLLLENLALQLAQPSARA